MLTNHFYKVYMPQTLSGQLVPRDFVVCVDDAFASYTYKYTIGTGYNFEQLLKTQLTSFALKTGTTASYGFCFGSGNTPPTLNDHTLSGDFIDPSTYQVTTSVTVNTENEFATELEATYSVTNISSNDIIIGEVGLCCYVKGRKTSSGSDTVCPFMVERTVLDTPVTIPAGGIGQVTYTIRMNYPTV